MSKRPTSILLSLAVLCGWVVLAAVLVEVGARQRDPARDRGADVRPIFISTTCAPSLTQGTLCRVKQTRGSCLGDVVFIIRFFWVMCFSKQRSKLRSWRMGRKAPEHSLC